MSHWAIIMTEKESYKEGWKVQGHDWGSRTWLTWTASEFDFQLHMIPWASSGVLPGWFGYHQHHRAWTAWIKGSCIELFMWLTKNHLFLFWAQSWQPFRNPSYKRNFGLTQLIYPYLSYKRTTMGPPNLLSTIPEWLTPAQISLCTRCKAQMIQKSVATYYLCLIPSFLYLYTLYLQVFIFIFPETTSLFHKCLRFTCLCLYITSPQYMVDPVNTISPCFLYEQWLECYSQVQESKISRTLSAKTKQNKIWQSTLSCASEPWLQSNPAGI